jgi:uncharacterized membrane protein YdjX (TVP38/TMEM64 family)
MLPQETAPRRRLPVVKLAFAALIALVAAVSFLRGVNVGELIDRGLSVVRSGGPVLFFLAEALLPALGAPLAAFNLVAGEAFAPQMTMPGVVAAAMVAIAVNLALTYWLARHAFRPFLTRLVARYGYAVPRVTPANALTVSLVVRLTPGPPYFLQGYLLGLAEVPFRLYMVVSWLAVLPWAVAFIVLGKAAREGSFVRIATAVGVIVVAVLAVQLIRRKLARRES